MCKEMIGYERTAIMVLGSRLKQSGHEVKAAVLSRPLTAEEKKRRKKKSEPKFLLHSDAYVPDDAEQVWKNTNIDSGLSQSRSSVETKYNEALIKALSFQPDVVGYSVMTGEHYDILEFNKILKEKMKFISVIKYEYLLVFTFYVFFLLLFYQESNEKKLFDLC